METLWAPWRMEFIADLRDKKGGCVFCELSCVSDDRASLLLKRGKTCFVLMNRYPYNNGHLMIVPFKHTDDLSALTSEENSELLNLASISMGILSKKLEAEGFNCGFNVGRCAGAGILDHIHMHVVPRWTGDTNFLPIMGDTRSMPEYLTETYDRLVGEFEKTVIPE